MGGRAAAKLRYLLIIGAISITSLVSCSGGDEDQQSLTQLSPDQWPVDRYLGYDSDLSERRVVELEQVEDLIVDCMARSGFEYQQINFRDIANYDSTDAYGGLEYASDAWFEEFGFGITTLVTEDSFDAEVENEAKMSDHDEYLESLSPEELSAYYEALAGPPIEPSDTEEAEANSIGCRGEAALEVLGPIQEPDPAIDELRGRLFDNLQARIEADPRIVEDHRRSMSCLERRGYEALVGEDVWLLLDQRASELYDSIATNRFYRATRSEHVDEETGMTIVVESVLEPTGEDADALLNDDELASLLDEVHTSEREMASTYRQCAVTVLPLLASSAYVEARTEIEQQFINEFGAELDRLALSS